MTTGFQSVCKSTGCKKKETCGRYSVIKSDYQRFKDYLNSEDWTLKECYISNGKNVKKKNRRKGK